MPSRLPLRSARPPLSPPHRTAASRTVDRTLRESRHCPTRSCHSRPPAPCLVSCANAFAGCCASFKMRETRAPLLGLALLVTITCCLADISIATSSVRSVPPSQNYFTSASSSFYPWFHVISNLFCVRSCVLELFGCVSINRSIDE